jgi:hypothetical protein
MSRRCLEPGTEDGLAAGDNDSRSNQFGCHQGRQPVSCPLWPPKPFTLGPAARHPVSHKRHTANTLLRQLQLRSRAGPLCCSTAQVPRSDAVLCGSCTCAQEKRITVAQKHMYIRRAPGTADALSVEMVSTASPLQRRAAVSGGRQTVSHGLSSHSFGTSNHSRCHPHWCTHQLCDYTIGRALPGAVFRRTPS